jgi:alkylation response protein AidB-like acyl-CoA dehydrogenase
MEHAGRTTAPVPLFETLVLGAMPIAEFGSDALQEEWLPRVVAGEIFLTGAFGEGPGDPMQPAAVATVEAGGFRLSGTKLCVAEAARAEAILVSAACGHDVILALVRRDAAGVALSAVETVTGRAEAHVALDKVLVAGDDVLVGPEGGRDALQRCLEWANAGQAAYGLGVCEAALELTADYVKTRKQFGQPIAMFQAVGHRAADAYIDVEAIRLTTQQAAWRLHEGLPAAKEVAVAKYWVAEAGQRVVAAAQHLHGGVGVDKEYPLHRFYLAAKQLELSLGGTTPQLLRLGRLLAEAPDSTNLPTDITEDAEGPTC